MLVPNHVAIIMDGNGRWAQKRHHRRFFGHVRGSAKLKPIILRASQIGVSALTFYAFSSENWARPPEEITLLWRILKKYLLKELASLKQNNVSLHFIGNLSRLPPDLQEAIALAVEQLAGCTGLKLTFAVSYGAKEEIVSAVRKIIELGVDSGLVSEQMVTDSLSTACLGSCSEVDLLIRTSGELRLSNFLLWQSAYAELYFTETLWPDFKVDDFNRALLDYSSRTRRYGAIDQSSVLL